MSLISYENLKIEILKRHAYAQLCKHKEFHAARKIQCAFRGYKCRQHIQHLNHMAILIQKTYRGYIGRKKYLSLLEETIQLKLISHYNQQATLIQKIYRGYISRKTKFDYYKLTRWLSVVKLKNDEISDQTWDYFELERNRKTEYLNEMAKKFVHFIAKKLHHLLRTQQIAGIYSKSKSNNNAAVLTNVELLLSSFSFQHINDISKRNKYHKKCEYLNAVKNFYEKSTKQPHRYSRCEKYWQYRNVDQTEKIIFKENAAKEPELKFGLIKYPYIKSVSNGNAYDNVIELTRKFDILLPGKDFSLNTKIVHRPKQIEEYVHILKDFCLLHNLIDK